MRVGRVLVGLLLVAGCSTGGGDDGGGSPTSTPEPELTLGSLDSAPVPAFCDDLPAGELQGGQLTGEGEFPQRVALFSAGLTSVLAEDVEDRRAVALLLCEFGANYVPAGLAVYRAGPVLVDFVDLLDTEVLEADGLELRGDEVVVHGTQDRQGTRSSVSFRLEEDALVPVEP